MNWSYNKYIYFRYVEANILRSSEYRKYNSDLPKWLHMKPKYFTEHCTEKTNLAKDIKQENVKYIESIEGQYFLVKSSTIEKCYKVNLGNENTFRRCECDAWNRSLLPCKHMVSIFEYFPEFGWELLPVTYKTSPYINLDYFVTNRKNLIRNDNEKDDGLYTVIEDEVVIKEIPRKQYSKRTKACNCREILNQNKSLTCLVNDVDTLDALEDHIYVSMELLENEAPKEEGVIVQPVKVKRKVKVSNIKNKISKAKRIKSNLTGRAGVKAEQMKLSSNLTLPNLIKEPVNQILEEVAPADNAMYDNPMQETNNPNCSHETVKEEKCVVEEETQEDVLEESDDEIAITGYVAADGGVKKRRTLLFRR